VLWIALSAFALFFGNHTLRRGLTEVHTDFPNYYTAATLARRHVPLERYYDTRWFQRQMNYVGWGMQLGGYVPHTPLTMVPMLPLVPLPPMVAKQAWLILNVGLLLASVLLLARIARIPPPGLLLLVFLGYTALHTNFLLGQYYIFLLFLLALAVWSLIRGKGVTGGVVMGLACMLKPYTAPFIVYFAWKRQWRPLAGMAMSCAGLAILSLAWFGWQGNVYFIQSVLPRAMEGTILDPYNAGIGTLTQLLRHTFVPEAELNPHPLLEAPLAFFLLRPFLVLGIFVLTVLALPRETSPSERRDLSLFFICLFVITPYLASYVMVLLLVPLALLLSDAGWLRTALLATLYVLLCAPPRPSWAAVYPRVWLIALLYVVVAGPYWRNLKWRPTVAAFVIVCSLTVADAYRHEGAYWKEPPARLHSVATETAAIYSSNPAVSNGSIVYETIVDDRYSLKRFVNGRIDLLRFDGLAFHPSLPIGSGSPVLFELVARQHSHVMSFDASSNRLSAITPAAWDGVNPAVSPDGRTVAFISRDTLMIKGDGEIRSLPVPGPATDVAWFPHGTRLAFSAGRDGTRRIFSFDLLSGSYRSLTKTFGDQREPAISPDGGRLAFTATIAGVKQIWVQDLRGGEPWQLTDGECNNFSPAWQSDSTHLLFASDCRRGLGLPSLYRAGIDY